MCELLGICYSKPVIAEFSLRSFAMRDVENAQGWGLAWYRGRSLTIAKEPITWRASGYSSFLASYPNLQSHIFIAHVRKATVGGEPKHADTHPFARELRGREFCFAHNGTLREARAQLPLGRFTPIGETDSEHVFCHLLYAVEQSGLCTGDVDAWRWLHERLAEINRLGTLNCLLSDGDRLFAYHDAGGFKGLHVRDAPLHQRQPQELEDATVRVDIKADDAQTAPFGDPGVVIATRPLNEHPSWRPLARGELVTIERGRIVHSSETAAIAVPSSA